MNLLSRFHPNAMRSHWMAWHRRLGLITCVGILMWGVSGFSHPIMSRLQPKPAAFTPPGQMVDLDQAVSIKKVLADQGIQQVQRIGLVSIGDQPYYRVSTNLNLPARYFSAQSGKVLPNGDRLYAEMLASHYTGLPQNNITNSRLINSFDDDYHAVNRLLPVWRVEFSGDSHLRAFIDTDQSRLSTLVDDTRYKLTKLFTWGHNWAFADQMPILQISVMALVLSMALFSAGSGLYLFFSRRRNVAQRLANNPVRRWHRRLGLVIALTTLMFASSGAFHLIMSFQQSREAIPPLAPETVLTNQLSEEVWKQIVSRPVAKLDLLSSQGKPMWLLHTGQAALPRAQVAVLAQEHDHHGHSPATEEPGESAVKLVAADRMVGVMKEESILQLAQAQAASYSNLPVKDIVRTELVTRFGDEYGFIFKRLPVVKVQFKANGNPRYYIEPATGALASQVEDIDALEGFSFAYLHKWNYDEINKDFRDVLVMLFAFGNIAAALMGIILFSRR